MIRFVTAQRAGLRLNQELAIQSRVLSIIHEVFGANFYFPSYGVNTFNYHFDRENKIVAVASRYFPEHSLILSLENGVEFIASVLLDEVEEALSNVEAAKTRIESHKEVLEPQYEEVFVFDQGLVEEPDLPFPIEPASTEDFTKALKRVEEVAKPETKVFSGIVEFRKYTKYLHGAVQRDYQIIKAFERTHFGKDPVVRKAIERITKERKAHNTHSDADVFTSDPQSLTAHDFCRAVREVDCKADNAKELLKAIKALYDEGAKNGIYAKPKIFNKNYMSKMGKVNSFRKNFPDGDPLKDFEAKRSYDK